MRVLIVPAAGLGSRLKTTTPKLLVEVNGRAMVDHLLALYADVVDRVAAVVHPGAVEQVQRHCAGSRVPVSFDVQPSPTGMLDAILIPMDRVRTWAPESVWITWCDQIAVHPDTIRQLARESDGHRESVLIFPTVTRPDPYTHLVRDRDGRIVSVLQRREGDAMPDVGESEMGLFALSADGYRNLLPACAAEAPTGVATEERNFLPCIPRLAARGQVRTFPAQDPIEAVGVNTPDELRLIAEYLNQRDGIGNR
jgi:bifunctional UDP-N-acetylglucosamine pyrophosphorylase/glucosamine-1-phosphate N-acetyltransferase